MTQPLGSSGSGGVSSNPSVHAQISPRMSTLENEVTFRKQAEVNQNLEAQFDSSSTDFILITDHRTSKSKSLEQLEASKESRNPESCCSRYARNIFRKKTLLKRLPFLTWLPHYNRQDCIGDLIAGFTVGLTVIPQGLAYSGVVGLPPEVSNHAPNKWY